MFWGSAKRRKYHDESTNVSIVSVSRRAGPPHFGHFTLTQSATCASGSAASTGGFYWLSQISEHATYTSAVLGPTLVIGVGAGIGLSRYLASLFFGVSPANPATYLEVALIMISIALVSCLLPAWRAIRVNPMVALRYE